MGRVGGGGCGGGGTVADATFLEHIAMVVNHAVCSADLPFRSAALELVRLDDRTGKPKDKG